MAGRQGWGLRLTSMHEPSTSIQVNFSDPFPIFPLDGVVLLPHALLRLFVFEPRYRQMVEDAMAGSGQIAMAVFEGQSWRDDYYGCPPIRPSVCVGRIVQHEEAGDGNCRILLQGVCRARIVEEESSDGARLYREAYIEPIETETPSDDDLFMVRDSVLTRLGEEPLGELVSVRAVEREMQSREIPTAALLEVVTLSVLTDKALQYRLLSEGDVFRRGEIVEQELGRLGQVLTAARRQFDPDAPKGVTWN